MAMLQRHINCRNYYCYYYPTCGRFPWSLLVIKNRFCLALLCCTVAFPLHFQLCQILSTDFVKEGWLNKAGPRANDAFRRRWVTLDKRKFMYYDDPLVSLLSFITIHYIDLYSTSSRLVLIGATHLYTDKRTVLKLKQRGSKWTLGSTSSSNGCQEVSMPP